MVEFHPLYGQRKFKSNHYVYSVFIRNEKEWWMYARHETNEEVYFLGKILEGKRIQPQNDNRWDWSVTKDSDRLYNETYVEYLKYNRLEKIVEEMDKRTYQCYTPSMTDNGEKKARNRRIVELVEKGKSYTEVAHIIGLKSKGTVANIYLRDREKYGKKDVMHKGKKLSPVAIKRSLVSFVA